MRKILFRGKRVDKRADEDEWVYGVPFFEDGKCFMINDLFICDEYQCTGAANSEVIPETVGQYTGLTDKNGRKIFEGDILESRASENKEDWKVWQVGFEDGSFVFDSVRKSIKSRRKFKHEQNLLCACEIDFYGLVKIGNIHDNPELLEEHQCEK